MTTHFVTACAIVLAVLVPVAAAADYPEKPVSFVVPWPPGDVEDLLTRLIAEEFEETYGVPAAVVNKPGGGGGPFPGAVEVANAPADGYTIGSFVVSVPVSGPHVGIPALSPDPFDSIAIFMTYPFVLATSKSQPYSTMEEMVAYAQDNPVVLGHFGSFMVPTQVSLALAKMQGMEYAADSAFDMLDCNSLASGDVDVINTNLQLVLPCIDDVTVLIAIADDRLPKISDVPAIGELQPKLNVGLWNGLFVHKDTPADVREKIAKVAKRAMASERAQKIAADTGALVYWKDAETSAAQIESDIKTIGEINAMLAE